MARAPAQLRFTFLEDTLTRAERNELRRGNRIQIIPPKWMKRPCGESQRACTAAWWEVKRLKQRHDDGPVTVWLEKCP
jgi:hypothetical protein